ncbi:MAG: ATP-binding cassette domain-containing protein, partial [Rhodospirillales bacterium]|nr:ATP-binding cassette domain-containing protein [Rhodospirillales bacterium]
SGGQQQRVAIARAIISRPQILFADEPTGNVDDQIAKRLLHLFDELNKLGTTVVIATHNEALVRQSGRSLLRLDEGELSVITKVGGNPEEVEIDGSIELGPRLATDNGQIA